MNETDRKYGYPLELSRDDIISNAKLPTKFGSLKELYEGISKEVFDIIGVEIIAENVVYDADRIAEYFVDRMPKLKDSKDIDEAYRSFKLLGKEHDTIRLYMAATESTWFYNSKCKSGLVDRLYKVAFGMIYGELYFNSNLADGEQFKK